MVDQIGVGIILSAPCLALTLFYFKLKLNLKFLVFQFTIHHIIKVSTYFIQYLILYVKLTKFCIESPSK